MIAFAVIVRYGLYRSITDDLLDIGGFLPSSIGVFVAHPETTFSAVVWETEGVCSWKQYTIKTC